MARLLLGTWTLSIWMLRCSACTRILTEISSSIALTECRMLVSNGKMLIRMDLETTLLGRSPMNALRLQEYPTSSSRDVTIMNTMDLRTSSILVIPMMAAPSSIVMVALISMKMVGPITMGHGLQVIVISRIGSNQKIPMAMV